MTKLNWYNPTSLPLFLAGAISDIYAGAAIPDIPTPTPPKNLNAAKVNGSLANADPRADRV